MIYGVNGAQCLARDVNQAIIDRVYGLDGGESVNNFGSDHLPLAYADDFRTFNTEVWQCKSGWYKENWHYMPEDYSQNVFSDGKNLVIRNLHVAAEPAYWTGMYAHTQGMLAFKHGRLSVKMQFPRDANLYHVTFWLLGAVRNGEIDLAECNSGTVSSTVHVRDTEEKSHSFRVIHKKLDVTEWHVYSLDWDEERVEFYVDGILKKRIPASDTTFDGQSSLDQPFYLVINTNPYDTSRKEFNDTESVTSFVDYIYLYSADVRRGEEK